MKIILVLRDKMEVDDTDWTKNAACRGMSPSVFIHSKLSWGKRQEAEDYAKSICATCPVQEECLEYALMLPPSWALGIWSGTTEKDRRRLRRERAHNATSTRESY